VHFGWSAADSIYGFLKEVAEDQVVMKRWPQVAQVLSNLGPHLRDIVKAMDDDMLSHTDYVYEDNGIEDDDRFQREGLLRLKAATHGEKLKL